ncbi:hypothetical protein JCM11491_004506 [Sporobolomyces phaffii]
MTTSRSRRQRHATARESKTVDLVDDGSDCGYEEMPFSYVEALEDPGRCRRLLNKTKTWEDHMVGTLVLMRYHPERFSKRNQTIGSVRHISPSTNSLECDLAEAHSGGLRVARIHQQIWSVLSYGVNGSQWMVEHFWENPRPARNVRLLVYLGLEVAQRRNGIYDLESRLLCPELEIGNCQEVAVTLIDLLRRIVESAKAFPDGTDYLPIVSKDFERFACISRTGSKDKVPLSLRERVNQMNMQHRRHHFIGVVVLFVLLGTLSEMDSVISPRSDVPDSLWTPTLVSKPRYHRESLHGQRLFVTNDHFLGQSHWDHLIERGTKIDDRVSKLLLRRVSEVDPRCVMPFCAACERTVQEIEEYVLKGKTTLDRCSSCFALDPPRKVFYCSIDCARIHWRAGHKLVCGKLYSSLQLPSAGFSRTPPIAPPVSITRRLVEEYRRKFPNATPTQFDDRFDSLAGGISLDTNGDVRPCNLDEVVKVIFGRDTAGGRAFKSLHLAKLSSPEPGRKGEAVHEFKLMLEGLLLEKMGTGKLSLFVYLSSLIELLYLWCSRICLLLVPQLSIEN